MRSSVLLLLVTCLALALASPVWSAPLYELTYDPNPNWGGVTKVFYEGWGFGPPAGEYSPSDPSSSPYRINLYGRGWTTDPLAEYPWAWVVAGENNKTDPKPKPPYYHLSGGAGYIHESNDWTNSDTDLGSKAYASYATGTYPAGAQPNYNQAAWLDLNGDEAATGPRIPIVLKHDVPTLTDGRKLRVDTMYWFLENGNDQLGLGVRIYFEKVGGGEAYADFALHYNRGGDGSTWG